MTIQKNPGPGFKNLNNNPKKMANQANKPIFSRGLSGSTGSSKSDLNISPYCTDCLQQTNLVMCLLSRGK